MLNFIIINFETNRKTKLKYLKLSFVACFILVPKSAESILKDCIPLFEISLFSKKIEIFFIAQGCFLKGLELFVKLSVSKKIASWAIIFLVEIDWIYQMKFFSKGRETIFTSTHFLFKYEIGVIKCCNNKCPYSWYRSIINNITNNFISWLIISHLGRLSRSHQLAFFMEKGMFHMQSLTYCDQIWSGPKWSH